MDVRGNAVQVLLKIGVMEGRQALELLFSGRVDQNIDALLVLQLEVLKGHGYELVANTKEAAY